ncbi:hypothetical protein HY030_03910 [Candidatus Gottesmanbacteria bacterium]|nr:hypothetical protein [Candidatus Gottesmanbacteria bacterium]
MAFCSVVAMYLARTVFKSAAVLERADIQAFLGTFSTLYGIMFILAMLFQLVEDLNNPFEGHWKLTTEPFERAMKHIKEDY